MHYRVSVYNYFWRRFTENGWDFVVLSNELQAQNQNQCRFDLIERPFDFFRYRAEIRRLNPDAVILFLHMKDRILWPLIHWLKFSGIPVALWTKARNLDDPDNRFRNAFFDYLHVISDALILYTSSLRQFVAERHYGKVFIANNTINFEDFPPIIESKEDIKRDLGIPFQKIVLFAGRIGEERNRKKVDHLIDMFRELDRSDAGLVIVGSGLSDELRGRMNPANTRYFGEVHDPDNRQISRIFKMADICSIPGHVGLGLNQAFFWGLPCAMARTVSSCRRTTGAPSEIACCC
jgi:glycosyltransferase involved in cell wall biosynthesis